MSQTILRLPALKARTGLSRSTIYLLIAQGSFPRQIKLGARSVGWLEEEVERWIQERIQQSREEKNDNGTSQAAKNENAQR